MSASVASRHKRDLSKCLVKTTHVWILPNTWTGLRYLVKTTHVVFTKYIRHVQVFGKNHTCVVFTKHLRLFQMFGKNHTCVWKTKQACVFPNTGWYFLYLYLNLTNITQISHLIYILVIQDAQTQFCNIGKIRKTALYFTCVGIPTHIKQ